MKQIGEGSFGKVWQAIKKQSGEYVAIKSLKQRIYSWEECLNLKEVKCLRKINNHPNIVKLQELASENYRLYFVFEYMDCNLHQLMSNRKQYFSEAEVKNWCFQILQGLNYMHRQGYFHRDLIPKNLLVSNDTIKIADFGLAWEVDSCPPYTEYITTLQYRAPEMLLMSGQYNSKVDMWALGLIMAELITFHPLFPGTCEDDQLYKICNAIGSPTEESWAEGLELAKAHGYKFPKLEGNNLSLLIPSANDDEMSLIELLCSWDPCKRPTAAEALQHPLFQGCLPVPRPVFGDSETDAVNDENLASMSIDSCKMRLTPSAKKSGWKAKLIDWFLRWEPFSSLLLFVACILHMIYFMIWYL